MKPLWYIVLSALLPVALPAGAQGIGPEKFGMSSGYELPQGLVVGDTAPPFGAVSIDGVPLELRDLLQNGPIVLIFYRGQWCTVCTRYLSNLSDSIGYLTGKGATVIAVGPELPENAEKTKEATEARFHIVADTTQAVMKAYEVLFTVTDAYQSLIKVGKLTSIAANNGQPRAQLPVPATYVISKGGLIVYRQFDYNYRNRASVREMGEAVY